MTAGVRQTIVLVYRARLPTPPPWPTGPLPCDQDGVPATAARRRTYFNIRTARLLYGTDEQPCRWHQPMNKTVAGLHLRGAELLRADAPTAAGDALAVLHLSVPDDALLDTLRGFAHRRRSQGQAGRDVVIKAFDPVAIVSADTRPFTLTLATRPAWPPPQLYPAEVYPDWPAAGQWLWALASRSNHADYPPDPHAPAASRGEPLYLSADWRALVLRDGAAFLGLRADTGAKDPFFATAELNVRTLYLDALLLGMLQQHQIDSLSEDVASAFDQRDFTGYLSALEARIARFRSSYWVQHLTSHGNANDLLLAYQAQHRLPDRFAQILDEVADLTSLAQTRESQQLNAALGLLTVLGLPLGTALATLQVLDYQQPWQLATGLGIALVVTAPLLTTRFGRAVLRALRATSPDKPQGRKGTL